MAAAHSATSSAKSSATSPAASPDTPLSLTYGAGESVSALLVVPPEPTAAFVLAHGAGAGMSHAFMEGLAQGLAERRIATLRYQFAYMERGSKRPDTPALAHAVVRAAVAEAGRRLPGLPLVAGGKSFGGRMTSQAQAASPLPGVRGLVFVGFPLHPAGKPGLERAEHLDRVGCPMLFLQGTRDELADLSLLNTVLARLGARASLETFHDADHSFHVRASSGSNDAQVMARLLDTMAAWVHALAGQGTATPPVR
jgi:predicted alpha/beta-hydrolase family hydrolase